MKFLRNSVLVICLCLLTVFLTLGVGALERSECVSAGLNVLASETVMIKSGLVNNDIVFEAEDFERCLNVSVLSSLTVTELPSRSDGVLYLGGGEVSVGQTISRENIGYLNFVFCSEEITSSRFCFSSNFGDYEISCKMRLAEKENHAPNVSFDTKQASIVSTYCDVAVYGTLRANDADGDGIMFEVVKQPKNGTLILDKTSGVYRYLPLGGYNGTDSFKYVAIDDFGNYSAAAEVKLSVDMQKNRLVYADMKDSASHVPAIALTEKGILNADSVGKKNYFNPTETVSRLDFVVAAMRVMGLEDDVVCTQTVFDDDSAIPTAYRGYVSLAQQKNYVCGKISEDGRLLFSPNDMITRAEAAVILSRMISAETSGAIPVFADADDIPAWARDAVERLSALDVLDSKDGYVDAMGTLTKEQTAYMLYRLGMLSE
jgi:hypothetical protein